MSELKPCPFCGSEQPQDSKDDGNVPYEFGMSRSCNSCSAAVNLGWNTRPIEDALRKRIAELEEECASLGVRLHDEMSQLEIATDLGNKRWLALNDIYENGEKHNANWCKRIAQEGLGIKNERR